MPQGRKMQFEQRTDPSSQRTNERAQTDRYYHDCNLCSDLWTTFIHIYIHKPGNYLPGLVRIFAHRQFMTPAFADSDGHE